MITIETARVPKSDDPTVSIHGLDESSLDMFEDFDVPEFVPKLGIFGAPLCRLTTSVISLVGMMFGMVMCTTGACILLFIIQEEPVYYSLGVTLLSVGGILLFIGLLMWMSEFMCNDCLGKAYHKVKSAPLKNALRRRERLIASRATTRTGSRLSQATLRSNGTASTVVSNKF
uniref:Transmembrane protein n=1 Tax=Panagrolaimus sp. PS1159 TaxID=55785 RepID=A0AC35F3Z7_9BILA